MKPLVTLLTSVHPSASRPHLGAAGWCNFFRKMILTGPDCSLTGCAGEVTSSLEEPTTFLKVLVLTEPDCSFIACAGVAVPLPEEAPMFLDDLCRCFIPPNSDLEITERDYALVPLMAFGQSWGRRNNTGNMLVRMRGLRPVWGVA
jgi:hypothetical protein